MFYHHLPLVDDVDLSIYLSMELYLVVYSKVICCYPSSCDTAKELFLSWHHLLRFTSISSSICTFQCNLNMDLVLHSNSPLCSISFLSIISIFQQYAIDTECIQKLRENQQIDSIVLYLSKVHDHSVVYIQIIYKCYRV